MWDPYELSYENALKHAGAEVLAFESFGSYQGDWWAKVNYKCKIGWVNGVYGSCEGCDAILAEIGYSGRTDLEFQNELTDRITVMGKEYLENIISQEQAEIIASRNLEWDHEAIEMVDFIKNNKL